MHKRKGEIERLNEIIKVDADTQTVSARELHGALGIEKRFSAWFETNSQGFVEGEDFTSVLKGTEVQNNGGVQIRELQDYLLSVDMAKHIYKLYDEQNNPYGWRVEFLNFPESQLDEKEKYYIKLYADKGYQLRNVSLGGQGENRASGSIGERKAPKGYMQGIQQGKKVLARELSSIAEKHLKIEIRDDKKHNKVSQKQYEKFMSLMNGGEYDGN